MVIEPLGEKASLEGGRVGLGFIVGDHFLLNLCLLIHPVMSKPWWAQLWAAPTIMPSLLWLAVSCLTIGQNTHVRSLLSGIFATSMEKLSDILWVSCFYKDVTLVVNTHIGKDASTAVCLPENVWCHSMSGKRKNPVTLIGASQRPRPPKKDVMREQRKCGFQPLHTTEERCNWL